MTRRMSCAMTVPQVQDRTKTVTRRHIDTWQGLKPGDRLTLIEKGQGLKLGEKQRIVAEVEVTDVRIEPLTRVAEPGELAREGFPHWVPATFVRFWAGSHGYGTLLERWDAGAPIPDEIAAVRCRRIEWRYL